MRAMSLKAVLTVATSIATSVTLTTTALAGGYDNTYTVELNKIQILHLSEPAGAILIGNPDIADISVHSSDTLFLVGRGYGQTNLIILNNLGETVMDADVQVTNTLASNGVRLYNGGNSRETYSCAPYCLPAPVLGDAGGFVGKNTKGSAAINNRIATSAFGLGDSMPSTGEPNSPEGLPPPAQ